MIELLFEAIATCWRLALSFGAVAVAFSCLAALVATLEFLFLLYSEDDMA
jgi:predicted phosphoribosyltransferase